MTEEPLSVTQEDYRELATFLEGQLAQCKTPGESDELRRRLAHLYCVRLCDPARAAPYVEELLGPMEALIAKDPDDDDLRQRYVETAEAVGSELRAADALARAIKRTKANDVRERVGFEVATLYFQQGDLEKARSAFVEVVLADARGPCALPAARRLLDLEGESGDAKIVGAALEMIARGASDLAERQAAATRLLSMHASKPLKESRLAVAFQGLVDSPRADEALAWLRAHHERRGELSALSGVYRRQALRAGDPAEARSLALRSIEIYSFESDAQRIQEWLWYIEKFGPHHRAHAELMPLLDQAERWDELCRVLEAEIDLVLRVSEKPESLNSKTRPTLMVRLGQARLIRGDVEGALASFRECLSIDPSNDLARTAVERLMAEGDRRLAAADVLEPIYRDAQSREGTLRVLETRGELLAEPNERLAALASAADIADSLGDRERYTKICGRALGEALAFATDRVLYWVGRLERVAGLTKQPGPLAEVLLGVLGDRPVDSFERLSVAVSAIEALVAAGAADRALALCRRALVSDPSSPELLRRLDDLVHGSESPNERLARYTTALEATVLPDRRCSLMHAIAAVKRDSLGDLSGAVEMWRSILVEDQNDHAAYEALIDATTKLGDGDSALDLIDRARNLLRGPQRSLMTLRQATALVQRGDVDRALELCGEIVDDAALPLSALETIAEIARDEDDRTLYRRTLERIIDGDDLDARKTALERLGEFMFESFGDRRAAVESWKAAAQMCGDAPADQEHARSLYERALEAWSDDGDAAQALAELNVRSGDWSKIPDAMRTLIRAQQDAERCVSILLGLEESAIRARAVAEFVSLADELFGRLARLSSEQVRALARAVARVLVSDPDRHPEASQAYRRLVESFENKEDVADFESFVESRPGADERHQDRRWLYEWRAAHDARPADILVEWAKAEEEYGEPAAAIAVYERLREEDEGRTVALEALCRLKFHAGDFGGGLAAHAALREGRGDEERIALDLRTARALLEEMARPVEAAGVLAPLLAVRPVIREAHDLAQHMVADPHSGGEIPARFEEAAGSLDDLAALRILEFLVANDTAAPVSASRHRWLQRIVGLSPADPATALTLVLPAAIDLIDDVSLWRGAEQVARASGQPGVVADAYRRLILEEITDPGLADLLGRRMVALEEQCAIQSPQSNAVLLRVLLLAPGARWALGRVKVGLGCEARYGELLDLFDRAIDAAPDERQRGDLLFEAASMARDLAGELPRAIAYLESLHALRPEDGTVDGALEQLYEREGRKADLIELLRGRTARESGFKRRDLRRRVASLCLDLGDLERAAASVEQLLSEDARVADVVDLLERLLELPAPVSQSGRRRGTQPAAAVQQRAIDLLRGHYESVDRLADMVRIAERSFALATADNLVDCIRDLVGLRVRAEEGSPGAFARAIARVESDVAGDPRLTRVAYRAALHCAIAKLKQDPGPARADAEDGAWMVVQKLVDLAIDAGKGEAALRMLYRASRLPFERNRRRELLRAAASMSWEKLQDRGRAMHFLRELFDEDAADDIAAKSLEFFSELLDAAGQYSKLAKLWEEQAKIRAKTSNAAEGQACWERAAHLWERQGEWKEALRAFGRGAALGSDASFEALARIHASRREWAEVAKALESLKARSPANALGLRALRLAEAYVELDRRDRARACLEEALSGVAQRSPDTVTKPGPHSDDVEETELRNRLASLYRQDEVWKPLARLLSAEARRVGDSVGKLSLLREAAELLRSKLDEPAEAADLLEQAVSLDPRDSALRSSLVDLLETLQRWDQVVVVLRAQVELYGDQRSKESALTHQRLARALIRKDRCDEALAELRVAVDMQPTDAAILYDVARIALDVGELDLSEKVYRSLLLAHGSAQDAGVALPPRAHIFVDLSEIALRKGDGARAADLVDSAFDEAVEHGEDPRLVDQGLRARARYDLLARALERRVERGATLTVRAIALGDLVGLWKQHLGRAPELAVRLRRHGERIVRGLDHEDLTEVSAWAALAMVHATLGGDGGASMSGPLADRAIAELSKAVAAEPAGGEAIDLLSLLLEEQGRDGEIVTLAERRYRLLSSTGDAVAFCDAGWRLGRAFERTGRASEALSVYESVLDRGPTDAKMVRGLAGRLEDLGSKRVADCYEQWIAVDAAAGGAVMKRLVELRYQQGDRQGAVRALDAAVATNPADAKLLSLRASEREQVGDFAGSVSDIEGAALIDPIYAEALVDLLKRVAAVASPLADARVLHVADTLIRLERPQAAQRELELLLSRSPSHKEALAQMATVAAADGNWNLVAQAFGKLLFIAESGSDREELARIAVATAEACGKAGEFGASREPLERALEALWKTHADTQEFERLCVAMKNWIRLANLLAMRAEGEDDPTKKTDLLLRAGQLLLERANDPAGSLRVIAPLRKTKPDSVEALLLWAKAQVAMGRAQQALPGLYEAVERHRGKRSPMLANIYLEVGRAHLALDEVVEAFGALEAAFSADWRTGDVAILLGLVALDLGEEKAAERALSAVTTLPPSKKASGPGADATTKAVAFYHLACMALANGDVSKARRLANKALDGDPGHAGARAILDKLSYPRRAESAQ